MTAGPASTAPTAYARWVLAVLSAGTALNFYDRTVMTIVLQPMKLALGLSDTQVGLLTGLAFAAVYSLLAVPVARIADRGFRVRVLTVALGLWSLMTVACGMATNAMTMFVSRFGVGIGEAGGMPSTHALIADYFPPNRRASALSVIAVASSVGATLGLAISGVVSDHFGWRMAFFVAGAPGLLVALVCAATVREPRTRDDARSIAAVPALPFRAALGQLAARRSYVFVTLGATIAGLTFYAQQAWTPTYYIRSFGVTSGQIGVGFALVAGVPTMVGTLLGGTLVDRWTVRDNRAAVWVILFSFAASIPLSLAVYTSRVFGLALGASALAAFNNGVFVGPLWALIQGLAGERLRATATALYMMVAVLVGMSIGPLLAGMISDTLVPYAGADSLRWSMIVLIAPTALSLPLIAAAARTIRADLTAAEAIE